MGGCRRAVFTEEFCLRRAWIPPRCPLRATYRSSGVDPGARFGRGEKKEHSAMATVSLRHLYRKFGDVTAVNDVNIEIQDKEFLVLVGPSGCGKSTTLRL